MKHFTNRVKKVQKILSEKKLDAILLSSPSNIAYVSGFSNFIAGERESYVFITKKTGYLFTNALYIEEVRNQVKHLEIREVTRSQPFRKVLFEDIAKKQKISRIGFEETNLTVSEYNTLKKSRLSFVPVSLATLRMIKEREEIAVIAKACNIGDKAFTYILDKIKPGVTEDALAWELEVFIRKQHATLSFESIIAFGQNAAIPHHHTGKGKLKSKDIILLDFGVKIDNYCSDMTRTVFLGNASPEQKKMYETVRIAQQKAIEHLSSLFINHQSKTKSANGANVDEVAREYIISHGFPTIPHSVGHGIGLQIHEAPSLSPQSKDVLSENMVFSIEPGIYIPGFAGVRIEDLVILEKNSLRLLTNAPKDLIEL